MKLETMIEKVRAAGYHVKPRRESVGRPRRDDVPRCACGEMTLARAQRRAHKCAVASPCATNAGGETQ